MAIQCDAKGDTWFGLNSGMLAKWDSRTNTFVTYPPQDTNRPAPINDIAIDAQGDIWIASGGNGLYCFNPVTEKYFVHYFDEDTNSIYDNIVNRLTLINDSIIGISNKFKGITFFNFQKKTFTCYVQQNNLPLNDVAGIACDKRGNTWIATFKGLLRMNNSNKKIISFSEEDGLLIKNFQGNITILADGRMVIPAETGLVYFYPDNINSRTAPPDVSITGVSIFDKAVRLDSLMARSSRLNLTYNQNFVIFSFSSISFLGKNSTQYYYKLEGVNKDWVSTVNERSVNYTNLNPGIYTFNVKCENRDGVPSANVTTLTIFISPPWWETWWAYLLYGITSAGIVYLLHHNRILKIKREQLAQINLMIATQEEERKRISRDLHDDVGTKLSALKLFLSSLHEKAVDTNNNEIKKLAEGSEQFVTETIKDVRELLLNLSPSVLEEFGYITAVEGLVNKINETKKIHFSLVIFGFQQRIKKEQELALYRITQELINNVLKHAGAKNVSVQIGRRDNKIILMIEDDGKGFDITARTEGYGLHNMDARTKLLQGTLTIDSKEGRGTSVLLEIPDNLN